MRSTTDQSTEDHMKEQRPGWALLGTGGGTGLDHSVSLIAQDHPVVTSPPDL